jgi:hypothetical protein
MNLELVRKNEEFPFKNTPIQLTFEAEILRLSKEREEPIGDVIGKLAKMSGVKERQIYRYRSGSNAIPESSILPFCKQFKSAALVVAWLQAETALDEPEGLDIVQIANRSCKQVLETHSRYLSAFDDGQIDGFELAELKRNTAATVASFHFLQNIAEANYQRRRGV